MNKKLAAISLVALAVVAVVGVFIGSGVAAANADASGSGWVLGRGIVGTPESEIARGYRFRLKAHVIGDGTAKGGFAARVHLRNRPDAVTDPTHRIVGIRARFNAGALEESNAKLAGIATVRLANGDVLEDLPFKMGIRLGGRGEYGIALEIGDRALQGKGVAGDIIIFLEPSDRRALQDATVAR